jgi:hypothetical protein
MKRVFFVLSLCISVHLHAQWGVPPAGWSDFAIGLTDDATKLPDITTARAANTKLQYRVRYINSGVNTATNWYSWYLGGGSIVTKYIQDSEALGMGSAFNIYMLQEDAGAAVAIANMQNASFMQQYYWNIRDVAQKSNGHKVSFIIEPDTWGYLIKACYPAATAPGANNPAIRPNLVASCNLSALGFPELNGLPNTMAGVAQGIIKIIRANAPDATIGFHTNHWATWSNGATGAPCLGTLVVSFYTCSAGMPFWSTADIDQGADFQIAWYNELLGGPTACDKGNYLVVEKYGFDEGGRWVAFGASAPGLYYGTTQYQNWLRWCKRMGQGINLPLLGWQIPVGYTGLPNVINQYEDTFMPYFFANKNSFICSGFIGLFMGPGVGMSTLYKNAAGSGDGGWFFSNLRSQLDPGRPYDLNLTSACAATITPLPAGCTTLPVDFINVSGIHLNEYTNQVRWDVAQEKNVAHYVVERSIDGLYFMDVGLINPIAAEGSLYKKYEYVDQLVNAATAYYRIKEVDGDGTSTYSRIIVVGTDNDILIGLYPNPFSTQLNLSLLSTTHKTVHIDIYDLNGVAVLTETIGIEKGQEMHYALDKYLSSSGVYYLKIVDATTGHEIESKMVIKQ